MIRAFVWKKKSSPFGRFATEASESFQEIVLECLEIDDQRVDLALLEPIEFVCESHGAVRSTAHEECARFEGFGNGAEPGGDELRPGNPELFDLDGETDLGQIDKTKSAVVSGAVALGDGGANKASIGEGLQVVPADASRRLDFARRETHHDTCRMQ